MLCDMAYSFAHWSTPFAPPEIIWVVLGGKYLPKSIPLIVREPIIATFKKSPQILCVIIMY